VPIEKSREELIEIVRNIMECKGSEEEIDEWLYELKNSVQHPSVSDLIFYPKNDDVTPEEIVDEILSYKPLSLK
jgi:hypothetical protein